MQGLSRSIEILKQAEQNAQSFLSRNLSVLCGKNVKFVVTTQRVFYIKIK